MATLPRPALPKPVVGPVTALTAALKELDSAVLALAILSNTVPSPSAQVLADAQIRVDRAQAAVAAARAALPPPPAAAPPTAQIPPSTECLGVNCVPTYSGSSNSGSVSAPEAALKKVLALQRYAAAVARQTAANKWNAYLKKEADALTAKKALGQTWYDNWVLTHAAEKQDCVAATQAATALEQALAADMALVTSSTSYQQAAAAALVAAQSAHSALPPGSPKADTDASAAAVAAAQNAVASANAAARGAAAAAAAAAGGSATAGYVTQAQSALNDATAARAAATTPQSIAAADAALVTAQANLITAQAATGVAGNPSMYNSATQAAVGGVPTPWVSQPQTIYNEALRRDNTGKQYALMAAAATMLPVAATNLITAIVIPPVMAAMVQQANNMGASYPVRTTTVTTAIDAQGNPTTHTSVAGSTRVYPAQVGYGGTDSFWLQPAPAPRPMPPAPTL